MQFLTLFTAAALASGAAAAAIAPAVWSSPAVPTAGFNNHLVTSSSNGSAICVQGNVLVYAATSSNLKLKLPIADNQTVVTETFVRLFMAGSTFVNDVVQGHANVSGTYKIHAQLCYPRESGINANSVQFLTHGIGFDKSYWDVAPGYSYIDSAAANGYTTFSYDRLGVGQSDHPEANQIVQAPLELSIAHSLIQMLRNGTFASTSFTHVIGTGHSFGSAISQGITAQYPKDLDAVVLTGFSTSGDAVPTFVSSLDLSIAEDNSYRFAGLGNGYLVANNVAGNQFAFFKAQGFPPRNLAIAEATKQTATIGQLLTLTNIVAPAKQFTGPVDVVIGANDWAFCLGNCSFPTNQAAAVQPALYPSASKGSTSYLVPGSGHVVNLHYGATGAFAQIQNFIKSNGF